MTDQGVARAQLVDALLRLVLDQATSEDDNLLERARPEDVARVAAANVILVRVADRLGEERRVVSHFAAGAERERIARAIELMARISRILDGAGVEFAFPKAAQHYPDMGHDVDLLVAAGPRARVAELLGRDFQIVTEPTSQNHRWAQKSAYRVDGETSVIEVHDGRLGHFGEHADFAAQALGRRRSVALGPSHVNQFCPEDGLILQVMQRMYGHLSFRISDVVAGVQSVTRPDLDWDDVTRVASRNGFLAGVRMYLGAMNRILTTSGMNPIVTERIPQAVRPVSTPVTRTGGMYCFSIGRVVLPLFARALISAATHGRWRPTARLLLLPPVAGIRRVAHALSRN